jgi:hypothetical protein
MVKMLKRVQHDGRVGCFVLQVRRVFLTTKCTEEIKRLETKRLETRDERGFRF